MAKRTDANQAAIVDALRGVGATVLPLHTVGRGCPDLLVGFRGRNYLLEVKTRTGTLNTVQMDFHFKWRGNAAVVRTPEDALLAIGAVIRQGVYKTDPKGVNNDNDH